MKLIKKPITLNRTIRCGSVEISADTDIIVPDIKPDILKILQVDGTTVITNTDIDDAQLAVEGRVDLNILYVPDREDERIKSIKSTLDFSHTIEKKDILRDMNYNVSAEIEKIDFHAINSRKLRVKAIISICYEITETVPIMLATGIEDETPELCIAPVELLNLTDKKQAEFMVRDELTIPQGQESIEEILRCDTKVMDIDFKAVTGKIVVKGNLNISCLYLDNSCNIRSCDFECPFTEIFEISDACENTICDIDIFVKNTECNPGEDSDGDMRILSIESILGINITATEKVCTDVIVDCFCPGCETNVLKNSCEIDKTLARGIYQTTLRHTAVPTQTTPDLRGIYNVLTDVTVKKTATDRDKVAVEGYVSCFILYITDSEESPVYSLKQEIPFSCVIDTPGAVAGADCDLKAQILHTSYSLNSAGEAEIRCAVSFSAIVSEKTVVELIDEIESSPLEAENKKGIVIYFVKPKDTLWDIAKKYYVSQEELLRVNSLDSTAVIDPGMKLIIPSF